MSVRRRVRSALSGRFLPASAAKTDPAGTVVERVDDDLPHLTDEQALTLLEPIKDPEAAQAIIDAGGRAQGWAPGPNGQALRVEHLRHAELDARAMLAAVAIARRLSAERKPPTFGPQ